MVIPFYPLPISARLNTHLGTGLFAPANTVFDLSSGLAFRAIMHDIERRLMLVGLGKANGRHQSVESLFEFKHGGILRCSILFLLLIIVRAIPVPASSKTYILLILLYLYRIKRVNDIQTECCNMQ
jgi:hypothetical protein